MKSKVELHAEVDALNFSEWKLRALLHAMVDIGHITKLECAHPECVLVSREFAPREGGRGYIAAALVIDHIIPRQSGGTDRIENLQIVHGHCNNHRARGWKMTPEARAKISASAIARGGWQDAVARRRPGWNCRLSDAAVREIRAAYANGEKMASIADAHGVSYSTARAAAFGLRSYALVG